MSERVSEHREPSEAGVTKRCEASEQSERSEQCERMNVASDRVAR